MAAVPKKIVLVEWWDAVTPDNGGWCDPGKLLEWEKGSLCRSLGYVVRETAKVVTIAASYTMDVEESEADHFSGSFVIPRGMIKSIRTLKG